ncbi:MAG TPA: hypothetical protein ENH94_00845 [Phycisphaerales bacterium]|nr:hypothetical protein [Phycisphaerales bacterium]
MKPVHLKLLVTSGLIWGCSFAILGAAYMCLIFPQAKAGRDINAKLTERKQVHQEYKYANSERARKERNEKIKMLDEKLTLYVAGKKAIDSLPFDINSIADAVNVTNLSSTSKSFIDDSFLEIQNCGYIGYTLIDLEFTASFNNFARFVNELERHEPIIFVEELAISRNNENPDENSAKIALSAFIHNPEGAFDRDNIE